MERNETKLRVQICWHSTRKWVLSISMSTQLIASFNLVWYFSTNAVLIRTKVAIYSIEVDGKNKNKQTELCLCLSDSDKNESNTSFFSFCSL